MAARLSHSGGHAMEIMAGEAYPNAKSLQRDCLVDYLLSSGELGSSLVCFVCGFYRNLW
jgi:hypothetical protein